MASLKLLPCKYCQHKPEYVTEYPIFDRTTVYHFFRCPNCKQQTNPNKTQKLAAKFWNSTQNNNQLTDFEHHKATIYPQYNNGFKAQHNYWQSHTPNSPLLKLLEKKKPEKP